MEAAEVFVFQNMGVPIENPVYPTVSLRSGSHYGVHGSLFGQVVTVPANLPEEQQMALIMQGIALLSLNYPLLHDLLYLAKHAVLRFLMLWVVDNIAMFSLFGFPAEPLEGAMPIADILLLLFENGWRVVENAANISFMHAADASVGRYGMMKCLSKGLEHVPKVMNNSIYAFDYFISGQPSIKRRAQYYVIEKDKLNYFVDSGMTGFSRLFSTLRGVSAARNAELIEYQTALRKTRQKYRLEFAAVPTRAQKQAADRQTRSLKRDAEWNKYLEGVRTKLNDPTSDLTRDRHRCRPVRRVIKSQEMRLEGVENMSKALVQVQVMKRKQITMLSKQLEGTMITKENLDQRIREAIENPVNFNLKPELLVAEERKASIALKKLQVPKDDMLFAVGAHHKQ
ncbi:hypothetical protein PSACC_00463 [Paramicrosporidium saccamoebae]|uniref:Uncharacterized protein n=1 Tax=Paramicrosporidium saccamoebae TaxID=1246581 RepID=A0A2H9TPT3_9FUNG|nr:hypothetical protein PSACC_00463 [Paramicrosporidium saccamoebae]